MKSTAATSTYCAIALRFDVISERQASRDRLLRECGNATHEALPQSMKQTQAYAQGSIYAISFVSTEGSCLRS